MGLIRTAQKTVLAWDVRGCIYLNHWSENVRVAHFFKAVSRLGDGVFWYLMLGLIWMSRGLSYVLEVVYLLLASSLGTLVYKLLKRHTVRPRPYQVHQVIRMGERPLDHFSFPSGHTLHAVMFSTVLGTIAPVLLLLMLPFSVMIALSRMILGLHYPSDVLVGALLGLVVGLMILWLAPCLNIVL
jgi:undecaprenyl-diphosphatase